MAIRYAGKDEKPKLSPGSTGFVRRNPGDVMAQDDGRQHVAHRRSDEMNALQTQLQTALAEIADLRIELTERHKEMGRLDAIIAGKDAEIIRLQTLTNVDSDNVKTTNNATNEVVLSADQVALFDKTTKTRTRYPKGQEPWTLEGISPQAWRKRQAKLKQAD